MVQARKIYNQAQYEYEVVSSDTKIKSKINGKTRTVTVTIDGKDGLIDPIGNITGCNGQVLPSYAGYSVFLFNTIDRINPTSIVALDRTTLATGGLEPNSTNLNPFSLTGSTDGRYNFLFNLSQTVVGKSYILVVKIPENSSYGERRVVIDITGFDGTTLSYQATSLDGKPLSTTESNVKKASISIADAARIGLVGVGICESQPAKIVKTADRATAEPGDTVVYRITLSNNSDTDIPNPIVADTLPLGMFLRPDSIRASLGTTNINNINLTQVGQTASFKFSAPGFSLPARKVVNLVYAVTLDADAIRGTGQNSAVLEDSTGRIIDGPATHLLSIRQGLIRDTGTIVGRVFVDKNFDGQQQANEPGIPNAVIYMDDGNRITTDANGLFSVQAVVAGARSGTIDLTSLPGYSLAPNLYFKERNSRSRLVKLAPGGIVRMNFGVTPTAREVK
ncbi:MAG: DUF11 domain-containing protein [Chamaesiphon sp.]|nr:DUF11 domain-containing protein [Chamaesiphon sp.]